ncbi:capsular exopolysaccharide family protein [Coleofasciculus chthonoplastes PCC 7420]|uniref:non-specific protein-tyrosine kinase n=1 Tax=Coleofasciculus chthonoplastes PCC 7420 TaxID=118168 RepID=B4W5D6_9CYAN|nr:polysaccharide biosynthesis tyrosine autokinase [Coleofasciculus chthonoplastes]EDX70600.1 capsular exopolysaccharide family protein [Coleofasciculus chthonoplastes PCC 7420]
MNTDYNFQPLPSQPNGKPSQALPVNSLAEPDEGQEQTLDLQWLFAVVRRRAPVMAGVAIILTALIGGFIVWKSKSTPPTYEGYFRLLVEPVTAQGRLAEQFLMAQTQGENSIQRIRMDESSLDYETQIRVLRSPKLIEPILENIKVNYPNVTYNNIIQKLSISRVQYEKDGKQQGTKILHVTYKDKDPQAIEFALSQVADAYLKYSLNERQTSLRQGLDFLGKQLPDLHNQVNDLQKQLQTLRQQYNFIDPERTGMLLSEHALAIQKNRLATEAELSEQKALYATLQNSLQASNGIQLLTREGDGYAKIIGQLQDIETQIAVGSSLYREDSEPMQILREQEQNLNRLSRQKAEVILQEVAGQIQGLEEQYQNILQAENQVNQQLQHFPEAARRYSDLQQKLDVATGNLKEFLQKREALRLDTAQQEVPWQLIEGPKIPRNEAGNLIPAEAKQTKRQVAIAIILSTLLGIGVGFIVEILHTVFHTPEEIKNATKLPLLGVIPIAKKLEKLPQKLNQRTVVSQVADLSTGNNRRLFAGHGNQTNQYSTSPFMEAFRSLYTNIRLLKSKKPIHSLAVSSAIPGDGKTTVAVYLAKTAAAIGQRVLLVDTDLRVPQLHKRLDLPNSQGLSDIITTNVAINEAIHKSPLDDNFFVLTAGLTLSDPIKLLASDKMQYLMEQFSTQFDLVIYDTPPLLGLGDGNLIAAQADGTLLVVAIEKTDRSLITKAFDGLKIAGASILGIVANGAKAEKTASYASYRRQAIRH